MLMDTTLLMVLHGVYELCILLFFLPKLTVISMCKYRCVSESCTTPAGLNCFLSLHYQQVIKKKKIGCTISYRHAQNLHLNSSAFNLHRPSLEFACILFARRPLASGRVSCRVCSSGPSSCRGWSFLHRVCVHRRLDCAPLANEDHCPLLSTRFF